VSDESGTVVHGFLGRAVIGSHVLSAGPSALARFAHQADDSPRRVPRFLTRRAGASWQTRRRASNARPEGRQERPGSRGRIARHGQPRRPSLVGVGVGQGVGELASSGTVREVPGADGRWRCGRWPTAQGHRYGRVGPGRRRRRGEGGLLPMVPLAATIGTARARASAGVKGSGPERASSLTV
jgi:hypothetical protein